MALKMLKGKIGNVEVKEDHESVQVPRNSQFFLTRL
jgi:hypothetical protein